MNWATDRNFNSRSDYKKFKVSEVENEVVYLTIEEFKILFNHEFESKRLEHVRDTFCFACSTGLRFSDIKSLNNSHIKEGFIQKNIEKTRATDHRIPLNDFSNKILSKYKDTIHEPLPLISNQKYNDYIKECCKEAGINSLITISRSSGGQRSNKQIQKWQAVTSHTARKTFATNSLILGMDQMVVQNLTGHKKFEHFKKYVKIAEDVKTNQMDAWNNI